MTIAPETKKKFSIDFLRNEIFLGTLVAVLSILTALAAYIGSISDSQESDNNVEGQKTLSLSNTEFLRTNSEIAQDYSYYDNYYIYSGERDDLAEYYHDNFSETLAAAVERDNGVWDDEYYDTMYKDADDSYDEAMEYFDKAQAAGDKADGLQLDMLILAVALSLSAWASLVSEDSKIRPIFGALSSVIGIVGLVIFITMVIK
jgi:tetratricopeptide (TPR) repeat protein